MSYVTNQVLPFAFRQLWCCIILAMGSVLLLPAGARAERVLSEAGELTQSERRSGDSFEVEANQGDLLAVHLTAYGFYAMLEVTCTEAPGQKWTSDSYQGQFHRSGLAVVAPASGTYQIRVRRSDSPRLGRYAITIDQFTGSFQETPALEITDGALTIDDVTLPGGEFADCYTLQVQPGELLRTSISTDGFSPVLVLENVATGDQWEYEQRSSESEDEFMVAIGNTTEVRIWVTSQWDEQTGNYSLAIERGNFDDSIESFVMNTHLERRPSDRDDRPQFGQPTTEFNEADSPTVAEQLQRAGLPNYECCQGYRPIVVDFNGDGYHDFLSRDHNGLIQKSICSPSVQGTETYAQYPYWNPLRDTDGNPIRLGWIEVNDRWRRANPVPFAQDCDPIHHETELDTIDLTDYDHDGDLDLLLGSDKGGIYLRRNIGTAEQPVYAAMNEVLFSNDGAPLSTGGQHAVINAGDLDGDGKVDILGASKAGAIVWFRNIAESGAEEPVFEPAEVLVREGGKLFRFQVGYSRVELTDHNGDGKLDISVRDWQGLEWVCLQQ